MFFSVKRPIKMNGKVYIPCVCYPITSVLEGTINNLVAEDKAVIYLERVFFQNGKVIPTAKMIKEEKKAEKKLNKMKEKEVELKEETAEDETF